LSSTTRSRQHRAGVDRGLGFEIDGLPAADGVEVLERETDRIDHAVALPAPRFGAMTFEPRAKRLRRLPLGLGQIGIDVRRRRRWRRPCLRGERGPITDPLLRWQTRTAGDGALMRTIRVTDGLIDLLKQHHFDFDSVCTLGL
jgi:hypothetical protein